MSKWLEVLIVLGSSGYIIDGAGKIISSKYNFQITMFTFFGEEILLLWLLIKGTKIILEDFQ